ncbi:MAG: ATP-binding protein [Oscillospiraceae bacterium]|nr:ATP-binding protein [Oscillospiraceae bacterium]
MQYKRHADDVVRKLFKMFGAVLVTGTRQVGKTTLLEEIIAKEGLPIRTVTLDDMLQRTNAIQQSATFLKDNPPPVFIDEAQYAPQLFPEIKMSIDREKKKGMFFLSGSQPFEMMKNVSESLAGRIGILNLPGISLRERYGVSFRDPFLPTEGYFSARVKDVAKIPYDEVWNIIHRGSFPELCANPDFDWQMFYAAYMRTYIERDVRNLVQVADEVKFTHFMAVVAAQTGSLLNVATLAREVGISQPTADRWLSVLVTSNIVYLLQPYSNNIINRAIKTPKVYFLDTGFAAYLTRWNTADVLKYGAMAGAFFETFVISEIIKSYSNRGILDLPIYFYRDRDGVEIDVLIEDSGILYPIEIKKHADPDKSDVAAFSILDKVQNIKRGTGGVVCLYDSLASAKGDDKVIPISLL